MRYKLEIKQIHVDVDDPIFKYFEFTFRDLKEKYIIIKDSIDDDGQGIDVATKQIQQILANKGYIRL